MTRIHSSISKIVRRRPEAVDSVWLEIQTRKSSILVVYIYRNPASTFDWYDQFVTMMDRVQGCKLNVVLLSDLNIDTYAKFHNILIWPRSNDYVTYKNHSSFFNAN